MTHGTFAIHWISTIPSALKSEYFWSADHTTDSVCSSLVDCLLAFVSTLIHCFIHLLNLITNTISNQIEDSCILKMHRRIPLRNQRIKNITFMIIFGKFLVFGFHFLLRDTSDQKNLLEYILYSMRQFHEFVSKNFMSILQFNHSGDVLLELTRILGCVFQFYVFILNWSLFIGKFYKS